MGYRLGLRRAAFDGGEHTLRRRGISLIELLTVLVIAALLATSLATSFSVAVRFQTQSQVPREELLQQVAFEDRVRNLISRAYVDEDQASTNTYFIGQQDGSGTSAGDAGTGSTELIFTTVGGSIPGAAIASTEDEFDKRNEELGPVGGLTEVRMALSAIGEAGDRAGLFLREQTPADEDPDQGGYESVIDDRVNTLSFEFFDGSEWVPEWDTRIAERRVPSAVRLSYTFDGDETLRVMVIKLRNSDVTPNNPANSATGAAAQ